MAGATTLTSPDWGSLQPMANEGERLKEVEIKHGALAEDFYLTKKDHEMRIRSIEKTVWMAFGIFSLSNPGLFLAGLAFIAKMSQHGAF